MLLEEITKILAFPTMSGFPNSLHSSSLSLLDPYSKELTDVPCIGDLPQKDDLLGRVVTRALFITCDHVTVLPVSFCWSVYLPLASASTLTR